MSAGCETGKDPEKRSGQKSVWIEHFGHLCHRMIPSYANRETDRMSDPSRPCLPAAWLGRWHCYCVGGQTSLSDVLRTSPRGFWMATAHSPHELLPCRLMTWRCATRCDLLVARALARPLCVPWPLHQMTLTIATMAGIWSVWCV